MAKSSKANLAAVEEPTKMVKLQTIEKDMSYGGWAVAFRFVEREIPEEILEKYGKVISKSEPDLFDIVWNQAERKMRDNFEI